MPTLRSPWPAELPRPGSHPRTSPRRPAMRPRFGTQVPADEELSEDIAGIVVDEPESRRPTRQVRAGAVDAGHARPQLRRTDPEFMLDALEAAGLRRTGACCSSTPSKTACCRCTWKTGALRWQVLPPRTLDRRADPGRARLRGGAGCGRSARRRLGLLRDETGQKSTLVHVAGQRLAVTLRQRRAVALNLKTRRAALDWSPLARAA